MFLPVWCFLTTTVCSLQDIKQGIIEIPLLEDTKSHLCVLTNLGAYDRLVSNLTEHHGLGPI